MSRALASLLLAGTLLLGPTAPREASAGPQDARALWDRARAMRKDPWRDRVRAYRAVIAASNPTDRLRVRALSALADVLRDADHPHGAAAAEALAASTGPRSDETRLRALLDHARAMRKEGDTAFADGVLEEVVRTARTESPRLADQALDLRSEDAFHLGDAATLSRLQALAEKERAAPHVRIRIAGRLGERLLAGGDRDGAKRCLRNAESALRDADRRADEASLLATRAWLDLPLRGLLGAG